MRRFAITHDYLCPFARNASRRDPPLQCGVAAPQALRGRLYLPAGEPYLGGHNTWCVNAPGSLLVIPVADIAQHLLAILCFFAQNGLAI
jgi:hypothetical protein